MAITNGYCTLAELKAALRITDNVEDTLLELCINAASRQIDGHCQRVFYSTAGTRVYVPQDAFVCETDDILSVTSITTLGTRSTFDTVWATSDYQLEPVNGIAGGISQPWTRVRSIGTYTFPSFYSQASVQIVGTFGWASVPVEVKQACVILAMREFKRYDSPLGVAGFMDIGAIRVGRTDPDVESLLSPYRKVAVA